MAETEVKKFLFDVSFDEDEEEEEPRGGRGDSPYDGSEEEGGGPIEEPEEEVPTFTEEEVEAARQEGYAQGKKDGLDEAASGNERRIAELLERLGKNAKQLLASREEARDQAVRSAVSIAAGITHKVFPAMSQRGAAKEIEAMVEAALDRNLEEPRLVVRIAPALFEDVLPLVEEQGRNKGFEGKMMVIEDSDLSEGDCRIEWADGGAERDSAALWQEIDEIIERNLAEHEAEGAGTNGPGAPGAAAMDSTPPAKHNGGPEPTAGGAGAEAEVVEDAGGGDGSGGEAEEMKTEAGEA